MPITVNHVLTATTPDNTSYEIRPSNWNSAHSIVLAISGTDISNAFTNSPYVTFGTNSAGYITASANAGGGGVAISASGSSQSSGTIVFSNSNNLTFGMSGATITGSASFSQSVQTQASGGMAGTGFTSTSTAGTALVGTLNSSGLSLGIPAYITTYTQPSTVGLISAINFSAGTTSSNASNLVFSNSNNISFGLNGATITGSASFSQSVQTQASGNIGATGFATTSTTGTAVVGTNNTTGFTLGVPSFITTYAAQTNQTVASGGIAGTGFTSASTAGTALVGTLNSSGLSLGIPAYITTYSQSVQTQASGGIAGTGFTSSSTAGTAVVGTLNSSGLSLGIPAYITTYASQTVQTQASGGIAGSGFTSASTAGTAVVGTLNSSGLSLGIPAYITTYVAQTNQPVAYSAANGSANFSTLTFANSNGVSFSTGTQGLYATVVTNYQSQGAYLTTAMQSQSSSVFAKTGFTTSSTAGTAITGTHDTNGLQLNIPAYITTYTQPNTINISASGNTTGTLALVSTGTLILAGGNNITLSQNGQSITISGANVGGAQTAISGIQISNATYTSGTVTFQNANGISFGSSGANGISASYTVPSTAGLISAINFSAGTTNSNATNIVFSNSNNISFGLNGATVTATATFAQSVQTQASGNIGATGFATTSTTGTAIVGTNNTTGFTLGVPAYITTYASQTVQTQASGNIAGTATSVSGNASITLNSNGLALNVNNLAGTGFATTTVAGTAVVGTHNTAGLTLAIPPYITTYVAGAGAAIAAGTQTGSTGTIVFSNSNNITFGMSNSSIVTASFSQSVQTQASGNIAGSGFTSASTAGTAIVGTLNSGGINLGIPAYITTYATSQGSYNIASMGTLTFGGATGGTTFSNSATTIGLHAGSNITLSQSSNSIIIYGASGGGGGAATAYAQGNTTLSSTGTLAQSSLNFAGSGGISAGVSNGSVVYSGPNISSLYGSGGISVSSTSNSIYVTGPVISSIIGTSGISISTTSNSIYVYPSPNQASFYNPFPNPQTTLGQIGNGSIAVQQMMGLPGAISFSRLDVLASISVSSSSNSSHAGAISMYAGIYTSNGSTLSLLSSGSQSYQWTNTSSNSQNSIASLRRFSIPITMNVTQNGDYWIAIMSRTSTTNANWFTASNAFITQMTSQIQGLVGEASNATKQLALGMGMYSTTSAGMPASMAFTNITGQGYSSSNSALPLFYNAGNVTI